MFSSSNEIFIFFNNDCSLVKMTLCYLNLNFVLNLCAIITLQPLIILVANSLRIKILLGCFIGSSTSSYL